MLSPLRLIEMIALHLLIPSSVPADEPWDGEPFAATPVQIVEAVGKLPPPEHAEMEVLLDDTIVSFESDGRQTQTMHQVYRILTESGVDANGTVSAIWSPWHQKRPLLRARVINGEGTEHELIEKEISEVPVQQGENLYGDQRQLQAPLPAIEKGSIVETLIEIQDSAPYFAGGISDVIMFNRILDTRKVRHRVDIPEHQPFQFRQFGDQLKFLDVTSNGRRRLAWTADQSLGISSFEGSIPPDVYQGTQVLYCTARSWADVTRAYLAIVNEKLKSQDLKSQAEQILAGESDRDRKIEKLLAFVRQQIRYTGLLFGDGTIVPTPPDEILRRRYGDCKDQSILLVALLRAAGIDADPVLLRSTYGRDVHPELPGFGQFNHMIVCIRGDDEVWIDPVAALVPLGELPLADQGRLCLIVKTGEENLKRTPGSRAEDNGFRRVREIRMDAFDGTTVSDTSTYVGANASDLRQYALDTGDREFRSAMRAAAEGRFQTKDVTDIRWSSLRDLGTPLEISCRCSKSGIAVCTVREGQVAIRPHLILQALSQELLDVRPYMTVAEAASLALNPWGEAEQAIAAEKQHRRKHPLVLYHPQIGEYVCRVYLPKGFEVLDLPEPVSVMVGRGILEACYELPPDGPLTATFRVNTGAEPLTAADIEAWQKELARLCPGGISEEWEVLITARHASYRHFEKGEPAKAFSVQREEVAQHPEDIAARLRLAEAYAGFGFVEAGREFSLRTIELAPKSSLAYRSAGFLQDLAPLLAGAGSTTDRETATEFFRKSVELNPDDLEARLGLATHLLADQHNVLHSRDSLLEAASLLRPDLAQLAPDAQLLVTQCLFFAGQHNEVLDVIRELAPDPVWFGYQVAATSILSGPEKGLEFLRKSIPPEHHYDTLILAHQLLSVSRQYGAMVPMLDAALELPGANRKALEPLRSALAGLRKFEDVLHPESDPRGIVQRAFVNAAAGRELCGSTAELINGSEDRRSGILEGLRYGLLGLKIDQSQSLMSPERIADTVSLMKFDVEGESETGFRVKVELLEGKRTIYVAPRNGRLRIITTNRHPDILGEVALDLVDADDLSAARQLLQWATEELAVEYEVFNPFVGSPALRLWKKSEAKTEDVFRIRLAAIAVAHPESVPDPVAFLNEMREKSKPPEQQQIDRVLLDWLLYHKQWKEGLVIVDRLVEKPQGRTRYWFTKGLLLLADKQYDTAKAWAEAELERDSRDSYPLKIVADAALARGDQAESLNVLRRAADYHNSQADEFNSAAWAALHFESLDDRALKDANKAVELSQSQDTASLHTLATVCAELGQLDEAMKHIRRSIELRLHSSLKPEDYYVPGRVAEHLGMPDVAQMYYEKVISADKTGRPDSTARLAEKRLAIIQHGTP